MSDTLAQLNKDLRPREEQPSDLQQQVINFISELNRQRELMADVPEDTWKQLAQNCIGEDGKRETHWLSMLCLHNAATALADQIQRQFAPLFKAGLLERDLRDEELADALFRRPDNRFELSDTQFEETGDQGILSDDQLELSDGQFEDPGGQVGLSDEELFEQLNFFLSDTPK